MLRVGAPRCTSAMAPGLRGAAELRPGVAAPKLARLLVGGALAAAQVSLSSASTTATAVAASAVTSFARDDGGGGGARGSNVTAETTSWSGDGGEDSEGGGDANPLSWWMIALASGLPVVFILGLMWVCAVVCARVQAHDLSKVRVCHALAHVQARLSVRPGDFFLRTCVRRGWPNRAPSHLFSSDARARMCLSP